MNSIKTKVFSWVAVFWLLFSGFIALVPAQEANAQSGGRFDFNDFSNCSNIRGWVVDLIEPSRKVPLRVYTRLEGSSSFSYVDIIANQATPADPYSGSGHGYNTPVPSQWKSDSLRTVYTVVADFDRPWETDVVRTQNLQEAPCLDNPDSGGGNGGSGGTDDGGSSFDPTDYDPSFTPVNAPLEIETGPVTCADPDSPAADDNPIACELIRIINFLSVGVGIIIAMALIYSGILYITSRGDPNQTKRAVNHAWQAGIALILFIFGWALLNFLVPGGVLTGADQTVAACLTDPNVTCE